MKEAYEYSIEENLRGVPNGTFEIKQHNLPDASGTLLVKQFTTQTKGKGTIETFLLFPGIEVSLHQYLAERVRFHHEAKDFVLEINHCRKGRIGWNMRDGAAVYLGSGDLCIHSMASCADSEMTLPLGYYEGIAVAADLQELSKHCPAILQEAGFDTKKFIKSFVWRESLLPFSRTVSSTVFLRPYIIYRNHCASPIIN